MLMLELIQEYAKRAQSDDGQAKVQERGYRHDRSLRRGSGMVVKLEELAVRLNVKNFLEAL